MTHTASSLITKGRLISVQDFAIICCNFRETLFFMSLVAWLFLPLPSPRYTPESRLAEIAKKYYLKTENCISIAFDLKYEICDGIWEWLFSLWFQCNLPSILCGCHGSRYFISIISHRKITVRGIRQGEVVCTTSLLTLRSV